MVGNPVNNCWLEEPITGLSLLVCVKHRGDGFIEFEISNSTTSHCPNSAPISEQCVHAVIYFGMCLIMCYLYFLFSVYAYSMLLVRSFSFFVICSFSFFVIYFCSVTFSPISEQCRRRGPARRRRVSPGP